MPRVVVSIRAVENVHLAEIASVMPRRRRAGGWPCAALLLLAALAGCATHSGSYRSGGQARNYRAPGPPQDPWGPYIRQAATRFSIPELWVREVMRQESGGHEYVGGAPITSGAGAMGLMQVMPATYEGLRQRYGLGDDPYEPHDNIMAGAGYLREMYDRFGSPGFLAAYNAGPRRLDDYLAGYGRLPRETVNYVASIAPRIGGSSAMTGPLAAYAMNGTQSYGGQAYGGQAYGGQAYGNQAYAAQTYAAPSTVPSPAAPSYAVVAGTCDADIAFDPNRPCHAVDQPPELVSQPMEVASAPVLMAPPVAVAQSVARGQASALAPAQSDPIDIAALPPASSRSALQPWQNHAPGWSSPPAPRAAQLAGHWSVQVGAFSSPLQARLMTEQARGAAPELLASARADLPPTTPFGGNVLYRARLAGLTADEAGSACSRLAQRGVACVRVPPDQP
jgi:D-alanyl-D-alanine carboxypeptidase